MADLLIHEIPQEELEALAARGARHGRSMEEEARHLLHEAAAEQLLIAQLQQASAVEARLETAQRPRLGSAPARRRVRYEPTPRR